MLPSHSSSPGANQETDMQDEGADAKGCAYVVLVMKGDSYVPGALACAHSLWLTGTRADLVCMVTDDVSAAARRQLACAFDRVVEVPYLQYTCKPLRTRKQQDLYKTWANVAFTKWNALSLEAYSRVLLVDADKIVLGNVDRLFRLGAPAATFSSPWAQPFVRGDGKHKGIPNPYQGLAHGQAVPARAIDAGLASTFVAIGTMVLLEPSREAFAQFTDYVSKRQPFGFPRCNSMMDEQAIVSFYHAKGSTWTHIDQSHNAIPWHLPNWVGAKAFPSVFHFFNLKPWDLERDRYPDLDVWWCVVRCLLASDRYTEEQRRCMRGCFDEPSLEDSRSRCGYCQQFRHADWQQHPTLDEQGSVSCHRLVALKAR